MLLLTSSLLKGKVGQGCMVGIWCPRAGIKITSLILGNMCVEGDKEKRYGGGGVARYRTNFTCISFTYN